MSNFVGRTQNSTLYQQIANSKPAKFTQENKLVTGSALIGTAVVAKHAADHSQIAATVLKKGLAPALGAGIALYGGSMIHDAIVNSEQGTRERLTQAAEGGAGILLGTEIAGQALNVKALQPLTQTANFLMKNKNASLAVAATAGSAIVTGYALKDIKDNGMTLGNAMGTTAGLTATGLGATSATTHIFGAGSKAVTIAQRGASGAIGAGLGLATFALGKETSEAIHSGQAGKAVALGLGTAATGITSAHLLGNMTGLPALSNLGGKMLGKNPVLTGAVALTALGVGTYLIYNQSEHNAEAAKAASK